MSKQQYIELLRLRGITEFELSNETLADAIRRSGGEPTIEEKFRATELAMLYYANRWASESNSVDALKKQVVKLQTEVMKLQEDSELLNALIIHGVDNWEGYSLAIESLNNNE